MTYRDDLYTAHAEIGRLKGLVSNHAKELAEARANKPDRPPMNWWGVLSPLMAGLGIGLTTVLIVFLAWKIESCGFTGTCFVRWDDGGYLLMQDHDDSWRQRLIGRYDTIAEAKAAGDELGCPVRQ